MTWNRQRLWTLLSAVGLLALVLVGRVVGGDGAPVVAGRVVAVLPHDASAFTQGLVFADGVLYEGTGLYGRSTLRAVDPDSGKVLRHVVLPADLFGEGITPWRDEIIQLTWRAGRILRWSRDAFAPVGELPLEGEGWGLTQDGRHLILSDGSATLRFLDPADGHEVRRVKVHDGGRAVRHLNELEYIRGEVWANIWHRDLLVRIDPNDGRVLGYLDLSHLWPRAERPHPEAVLNGIAYDEAGGRLFVTGKLWPHLYQVELLASP